MSPQGESRAIPLSNGGFTLVDAEDFDMLSRWTWRKSSYGYAVRSFRFHSECRRRGRVASLQRTLLLPSPLDDVDHINGDRLDNRRDNLRLATRSQNHMNRRPVGGSSRYKGVSRYKRLGLWRTDVKRDGIQRTVGYFADEVAAALAYDMAAICEFGPFARPNFLRAAGWY